jgi:hypothetical protein
MGAAQTAVEGNWRSNSVMFTLINRGELNAVTEHEFENLNARLKGLWLTEHNEDGTHKDPVAFTDVRNTFTANQLISKVFAELAVLNSGSAAARFAQYAENAIYISHNLTVNDILAGTWNLDDISRGGAVIIVDATTGIAYYTASAGANPRTLTKQFQVDRDGKVYERGRTVAMGDAIAIAYDDANYTGNGGDADWVLDVSGDQLGATYSLVGNFMHMSISVVNSTIANAPTELRVAIPAGKTASVRADGACLLSLNGAAYVTGVAFVTAGGTTVKIQKADGTAFGNSANNNNVLFNLGFWVN